MSENIRGGLLGQGGFPLAKRWRLKSQRQLRSLAADEYIGPRLMPGRWVNLSRSKICEVGLPMSTSEPTGVLTGRRAPP